MRDQGRGSSTPFSSTVDDADPQALSQCLAALNAVDDGIYQLDEESRFVAVNDAVVETTGYARDDLLGEHVSVLLTESDADRLEREIDRRRETDTDPETTNTLSIETASGDCVHANVGFSLLEKDGAFEGSVGVARWVEDPDRVQSSGSFPTAWEDPGPISTVIDQADAGMFVLDETFDVVWIDETIEEYFGIDRAEVVGRDKRMLVEESISERFADPESFAETVLATYDDNTYVEQFECQLTAGPDRAERWLEHRSKPIEAGRYAGGRVELYYDITARKEQERELRREYELTDKLLETSPVGIAVIDADGSTLRANERMTELLDLSDGERPYVADKRDLYDADGNRLPVDERPVSRVFETGDPVVDQEVLLKRSDGRHRWLSINARAITDEDGTPEQVVETATDVTELKQLLERRKRDLREREKELEAVQLSTNLLEGDDRPVSQLVQEFADSLPQFFLEPAETAVQVTVGETVAKTAAFESRDRQITARQRTVNGTPIAIEVASLAADERLETGTFLEEEQRLIETLATLLKFHFDRREYIDDLKESNERLEQFAYAASHDLQEPLRMVSSYLQLIESRYADDLDEDGREFLAYAVDGADRMREMIDGLLEYSRIETQGDPFEPVDLETVLEDVQQSLEVSIAEHDAEITADSLPVVVGDERQLHRVFQNLLENAITYSGDEPPRVHVSAERRDAPRASKRRDEAAENAGPDAVISVRDEGIGIAEVDQERIFEVFQRLHGHDEHAGIGIGLAMCRRIVERHGGRMWVESEPGEGTTVSFTVPLAAADDR
ncbi:PAS domain-containing sensor histidine kinase [Natrarchaeobaculum aegyptiacum]|uniref:histidine kinase n=1 Tax=Natrarchaeobaculum aegyptiacum TaxID=745377 RepID=A0A2Z2HSB0_9EURY|nr:PAS domain S-box protein [Natrarchaeobaculum aegyptiacum]ARS90050.1 PAS domain-containing sensor histidine kinase [Natrarchaeobaculum aegyptiacum]